MRKYTVLWVFLVLPCLLAPVCSSAKNERAVNQVSQTDWTTQLIGIWQGKIRGENMELALWIPQYYTVPWVDARLSLYMQTLDGQCIYGDTKGHLPSVYSFDLPKNKEVYEDIILKYYFMPDVYNDVRNENIYCSKNRPIYPFLIYYDQSAKQVFAQPKGYQPGDGRSPQWPLHRVNPSQKMSAFLSGLERKYGPSFFGAQKYLLFNKDAEYSSYKDRIPVSCQIPHRFALTKMYKQGLSDIEAFPVAGSDMVEVKLKRMVWNDNGKVETSKQLNAQYPETPDVDWAHLSMRVPKAVSEVTCKEALATLSFLPHLYQQKAVTSSETPKIKNVDKYFLVNASGVDQVRKSERASLGSTRRLYGGTTIFSLGDRTRQFRWEPFSQKMVIQNDIKSVFDNQIQSDRVNNWDERKFVYDAALSDQYASPVFVSTAEIYEKDICVEWQGQVNRESCIKSTGKGQLKKPLYLTDSQKTAIAIYKKVSPQKESWKGLPGELGQCPGGVFCDVQGGEYLNAIYRNDFSKIRELDERAFKGLRSTIKKLTFGDEKFYTFLSAMSNGAGQSLLPLVVDEYMYGYQQWPKDHCLDSDAVVVKKNEYVPGYSVKEVYASGAEIEISRTEGYTLHATYLLNNEFLTTCNRFCGVQDSKNFRALIDSTVNKKEAMIGKLYVGIRSLRDRHDCRSEEVQVFENNLIALSRTYGSFLSSRTFQLSSW
ncbi:MAG: hypothetical protein PHD01_18550 [Geobacteraceae bacterium]|nr:hypothetical protein [Geobacteraceae bacterium]